MPIFIEIGLIVFIATAISFLMRFFKQPLIVGYILSGIILGPYLLNLIKSESYIELFSKLGIAILLFIVGLNLKPDIVREVGKVSLITGLGQIIITTILGFLAMHLLLGFGLVASILGAIALTFSSTIIVLKLISDRGDLDKLYGKISIGFLLVQDVLATLVLLLLAIIGSASISSNSALLVSLTLFFKGVVFFIALYLLSRYVLPKVLSFTAKSQELLFMFSMCWGLGLSAVCYLLGFSLEIGALAAGVALASSPFSMEIASRMKPLRDFFILLFFVLLGSQVILSDVKSVLLPTIVLSLFVLVGKPIIVFLIMKFLGYKNRTSFMGGLTSSQISEFSLILVALGFSFNYLNKEVVSLITFTSIITIAGSTYLFMHADVLFEKAKPFLKLFKSDIGEEKEGISNRDWDMIIFGYDRVGYDFVNVAERMKNKYFVVDFNPDSIKKLEKNKIPYRFGDAEDVDFLEEIGVPFSKSVISTIPDFKTNLKLVSYYRNHNKKGIIIAISHNIRETEELYAYGASFVVMPHYLGAKHASKMIENYGFQPEEFEKEKREHLKELEKRQKLTGEK